MPFSINRVPELEREHFALTGEVKRALEKLAKLRTGLRHLVVDFKHNSTNAADREWLKQFNTAADEAWRECKGLYRAVHREDKPTPITRQLVEIINAAKEVVQADNACILGRSGCEQRWDKAMENLKRQVAQVKD